ncbi:MAG: branched-chain amino acid ABC transporter permease [Rhodospirillales bacterium]|nr:branched-chain amino acid ABC transporter permease [Rhodospirillales bacterium]
MPSVTRRGLLLLAALALLLLLPAVVRGLGIDYAVGVATRMLIFALAGASLNLILGYGGMVSFGHAAFFGAGAYVVAILSQHATYGEPLMTWPFVIEGTESALIAWPLAMAASGLLALLIGLVCLRTSGLYFIMITLAFAQMIYFFFISLRAYGGEDGLSLFARSRAGPLDLADDVQFYYLVLVILLVALALQRRLVASRFGRVLEGARDNERRMQALGFPTYRYKLAGFVIAGAVAGLSGALIANQTEFVSPSFLDWQRSGEILVIVILGGMGRLLGPVAGAVAFLLLEEVLSAWTEHWMLVLGPILVLVVLFARGGLWSLIDPRERNRG